MSTKETYNQTIRSFDKTVGLKYLKGMHINDSKCVPHLPRGHQALLRSLHPRRFKWQGAAGCERTAS